MIYVYPFTIYNKELSTAWVLKCKISTRKKSAVSQNLKHCLAKVIKSFAM